MMDYNDGLLPEPCLRMDTQFGDEYESVEFGDGTGYVKAVPMLARLGALHMELDELRDENAKLREQGARLFDKTLELGTENDKLRELVRELWEGYADPPCEDCPFRDTPTCADCPICARETAVIDRMGELGVEVDG